MSLRAKTITFADGNAVRLGTGKCFRANIQADPDNANNVFVGDSSLQNVVIEPGSPYNAFPIQSLREVWVRGTAGEKVFIHYFESNVNNVG
jgi:hypothetical protein